jgi:hypothetical protein
MGSRRYLSLKNIARASLALGMAVGGFFVLTVLSFDPDGDFHGSYMGDIYVGRVVLLFLKVTALIGLAVLILGFAIRGAADLWRRLTHP